MKAAEPIISFSGGTNWQTVVSVSKLVRRLKEPSTSLSITQKFRSIPLSPQQAACLSVGPAHVAVHVQPQLQSSLQGHPACSP